MSHPHVPHPHPHPHLREPHFGWTRAGHAVHARTVDHLAAGSRYQRMNRRLALLLTSKIGTMTAFWAFWALCFTILPSVLHAMGMASVPLVPRVMLSFGFNLAATWLLSTCFQLTLLPALMVGQNLQNEAADARAAKTFEDVEAIQASQERMAAQLDRIERAVAKPPAGRL